MKHDRNETYGNGNLVPKQNLILKWNQIETKQNRKKTKSTEIKWNQIKRNEINVNWYIYVTI